MHADAVEMEAESRPNRRAPKMRLLRLEDLDRRTAAARKALELRDRLVNERGGPGAMGTLRYAIISDLAGVSAMIEDAMTRWFRGEPVDAATVATLINVRRRDAELVGIDPEPRDVTPSLADIMRDIAAQEAAQPVVDAAEHASEAVAPDGEAAA
jgi:hypothetical protein